ncbi:MAG TPA: hypothetical protein VLM40_02960 [Gemmata sp.]|nr:hypothetical protein [Gemmata sp.]
MRRRRQLILSFGLFVLLLVSAGGVLGYLLKCEPGFYTAAACPPDYDTREKASRMLTRIQELKNDIRTRSEWGEMFSTEELNCFFAEMMTDQGSLAGVLPKGFHDPRVSIEGDRLKLGLRYGKGLWSTVVWVELKIWLVADEVNLMGMEVCELRAGRVGIGAQSILDAIEDLARSSNVDVTWYRYNRNPVGLFRFFPDQPRPASQVLTLEVRDGKLAIAGRSITEGLADPRVGP